MARDNYFHSKVLGGAHRPARIALHQNQSEHLNTLTLSCLISTLAARLTAWLADWRVAVSSFVRSFVCFLGRSWYRDASPSGRTDSALLIGVKYLPQSLWNTIKSVMFSWLRPRKSLVRFSVRLSLRRFVPYQRVSISLHETTVAEYRNRVKFRSRSPVKNPSPRKMQSHRIS